MRLMFPAVTLVAVLLAGALTSFATPAIGKKEGKECTVCHVQKGKKELNDKGKEYKAAHPAEKK
ncbi:MAG: hypothetical protein HY821_04625 [Acidobacteria bacterium]|nr:hypothetical protein [Acidobacteriota bacterium]